MRKRQYVSQLFPSIRDSNERTERQRQRERELRKLVIINAAKLIPRDINAFKQKKTQSIAASIPSSFWNFLIKYK